MPRPGFADQQDLLRWADKRDARTELPRLMRRLVLETSSGVTLLDFPAAEGTAVGGWDGVARTGIHTPWIPAGLSLWELSVESGSANKKADKDYAKRTTTPDGSPASDATYMELIARRWRDRRKWAEAKSENGRWKEVRAYGIDDLEALLESAPVSHAWISEQLGLKPYGMRTADTWWRAWSAATDPNLTTDVVLAGRDNAAHDLRERLSGSTDVITLRAGSLDEVLAFVAALALKDEENGDGRSSARIAIVDDVGTWRLLADQPQPLILIPRNAEVIEEARSAPQHHVIVPLTGVANANIELPPIDATAAASALQEAGLECHRAEDAGRLARRSLLALRRNLARHPELHTPPWARDASRVIRGILLAGAWSDDAVGDQARLSELTGRSYEDLREELRRLAFEEDPLITRVGQTWTVVSPFDAWHQLGGHMLADDLRRFGPVVDAVLLEADPTLDLAPEDRWRASIDGRTREHSADLRRGLVTTIALLGMVGDRVDAGHGSTGETVASSVVRMLLNEANWDPTAARWSALSAYLPLLEEGAPDAFLDGLRAGLSGDKRTAASLRRRREVGSAFYLVLAYGTLVGTRDRRLVAGRLRAGRLPPGELGGDRSWRPPYESAEQQLEFDLLCLASGNDCKQPAPAGGARRAPQEISRHRMVVDDFARS
jgi:hypothetical protein